MYQPHFAMTKENSYPMRTILFFLSTTLHLFTPLVGIGVNYGTLGDNLPPPSEVADFLVSKTIIDSIKLFDTNPDILLAFADTNISVMVTVGNDDIPTLTNSQAARRWVNNNIKPFYPQTSIKYILVGNEILLVGSQDEINNLVPCMNKLYDALVRAGCGDIKVSTPHALNFLGRTEPPSQAIISANFSHSIFDPMLQFLSKTKSPLMINPYPYFSYAPSIADYTLFRPNRGVNDKFTKITYYNMYDALLDATYWSIKAMGYEDLDILVAETGWPSVGERGQESSTLANAASYNRNLVRKVVSGKGTPLMPNRRIETYLFALFQENKKPGPTAEKNWGLFWPDFTPVYNAGLLHNNKARRTVCSNSSRGSNSSAITKRTPPAKPPAASTSSTDSKRPAKPPPDSKSDGCMQRPRGVIVSWLSLIINQVMIIWSLQL